MARAMGRVLLLLGILFHILANVMTIKSKDVSLIRFQKVVNTLVLVMYIAALFTLWWLNHRDRTRTDGPEVKLQNPNPVRPDLLKGIES